MTNPFFLSNKNIVISGGTSGIGEGCVKLVKDLGGNPIVIGRNHDKIDSFKSQGILGIVLDLNDFELYEEKLVSELKSQKIHGFVHSAGEELTVPLRNLSKLKLLDAYSLNTVSAFSLAKIFSKNSFLPESGSSFVFISSIMSIVGEAGKIGYAASKGALVSGAKSMALELASKRIRVNSISPGAVITPMSMKIFDSLSQEGQRAIIDKHPLGLGNINDVAYCCAYLLSDASRWMTGSNIVLDGGYTAR